MEDVNTEGVKWQVEIPVWLVLQNEKLLDFVELINKENENIISM